jgi:mono/diheme cytochrome c family protein
VVRERRFLLASVAGTAFLPSASASFTAPETPEAVYQAACAACHGSDGTGQPALVVGFAVPLPDFTDCSFASREPAADWYAVAHAGGPVRGFDPMMPSFGDALTVEQLEKAIEHVLTFCEDHSWPRGELNLPRPIFTEKAFPEDEVVLTTGVTAEGTGLVTNELAYEKRFGAQNQVEVAVPFDFEERTGGHWSGGIGDVALGVKRALLHDRRGTRILSAGLEAILPTGNEDQGRGTGTTVVEPFAAYGQVLPWDGFLHLLGGVELPADTDRASREAIWRGALGKSFVEGQFGRTWSPMIEVLGARDLEAGATVQWDLVPQFQVTLNTRQHVMAAAGVRFPATDADTRATMVLAYLLWDWFDGGFFDGW